MGQRLGWAKVSRVHATMMDFSIWGRLTRPRGPLRAQGSALTSNVESFSGGLRVSAGPWALSGPQGLVKRPQMPKSIMMACMRDTLVYMDLGNMDFPDGPAAIH